MTTPSASVSTSVAGALLATSAAVVAGGAATVLPPSIVVEFLTSGISVSAANTATNPLDLIKVRMATGRPCQNWPNSAKTC
jgi:hypothetical protein